MSCVQSPFTIHRALSKTNEQKQYLHKKKNKQDTKKRLNSYYTSFIDILTIILAIE